jgi:phospholipid/cholesterol/gamma-HCH transport system ATP-binding protein
MTSAQSAQPAVEFENVGLAFDKGEVLRGLSFRVAPRETKVFVGETGTGKTVSMKLAAGLLRPDSGRISALGQDIGAMSEEDLLSFRRKIGFVFQEGALFDSMSVSDNVAFRLREENTDEDEVEERVREALRFVEMEQAIDQMPGDLSGGMRRRVSIARALVSRPELVFYDSPTAGLDPVTSQTIITLLLRLRDLQGVTALLATQRVQDAFGLANYRFDKETNRVVPLHPKDASAAPASPNGIGPTTFLFFRGGRIYFEGGPQALLDSKDPYLKKFLV